MTGPISLAARTVLELPPRQIAISIEIPTHTLAKTVGAVKRARRSNEPPTSHRKAG